MDQIECLKDLNCDIFQGYYFGKPINDISFENEFLVQLMEEYKSTVVTRFAITFELKIEEQIKELINKK